MHVNLGFSNVRDVNVGKTIRFVIEAEDEKEVHRSRSCAEAKG